VGGSAPVVLGEVWRGEGGFVEEFGIYTEGMKTKYAFEVPNLLPVRGPGQRPVPDFEGPE
jgi:hypothetical protein